MSALAAPQYGPAAVQQTVNQGFSNWGAPAAQAPARQTPPPQMEEIQRQWAKFLE